jgi:hypothetical protein
LANPQAQQSAVLDAFLGLITNCGPESLPEGASPLTWDTDYITGSVFTRPGLVSVYTVGEGWGFDWGANWGGATIAANFNYIKSLPLSGGGLYTVALDTAGNLWSENVITNPGVLIPLFPTVEAGSYAFSVTQSDFEYICFSDLVQGTDIPRQYNPQPQTSVAGAYTLDRISQVGPGAPPTFQVTSTTTTTVTTITSWAGVGSIVTFQAVNSFTAGQLVKLGGFAVSTFFNNQVFSVLSTGLSGSQFEVSFAGYSGPSDSGTAVPQYTYDIASISQPAQQSDPASPGHFSSLLWSAGVGSKSPGNVITVYYKIAFNAPQDSVLANAFNSGLPTYVYISGAPFGNGTQLVTSIGQATPPGAGYIRWYFTFQTTASAYQFIGGPDSAAGQYQVTLATLVTKEAVPNLNAGDQITIANASPSGWNSAWTITQALLSGTYNITQTSMDSTGIATYNWTWAGTGGAIAPQAKQLVTVVNTLGGNGIYNVASAIIATVTGGPSSGTFTISGFPAQAIAAVTENGQATTAGTTFTFDPGAVTFGSNTSPIYGNDNGSGQVTVSGANTAVAAGTRQAVCFFETRNGLKTAVSAPITFTTNINASYIQATNIPIGPPNVIRRWIAFTTAGQNGIPGPNFYTIDTPVSYTINNQTLKYTATYVDDNTTTQAKFTFTDAVLTAGEEIDVQGNNLFSQIELGSSAWNIAYAGRMFYGLEQNKVLNFTNMSFDGGYVPNPNGPNVPLGWGIDPTSNAIAGVGASITSFSITANVVTFQAVNTFVAGQVVVVQNLAVGTYLNTTLTVISTGLSGSQFEASFVHADVGSTGDTGSATPVFDGVELVQSDVFGNAILIENITGITQGTLGLIYQNAFQDAYNVPIILPNVLYSVRVTASIPSGLTTGTLIVDLADSNVGLVSGSGVLSGFGQTYGTFSVNFSSMSTTSGIFSGTLLTIPFSAGIPPGLVLRVWAKDIGYGANVKVDRVEVYPTTNPINTTNIRVSYVDNFEAFDAVTGNIGLAEHNTQQCFGAVELHDQLYFLQSASMQSTQDIPGTEPSGPNGGWSVHEVSNRVGTCGIHAYDYGEEWILTACRNGLFGFNGGQPVRVDFQQKEIWELINWNAGHTIWVRNDLTNRRITVGVPLPTPNKWLPLAPVNTTPTTPNVILMWNWHGLNDFQELVDGRALHTTMFGTLAAVDMRLKFSIWQIPSPYSGMIEQGDTLTMTQLICGGVNNDHIFRLDPTALSDDGTAINGTYFTYGFVNSAKATQNPLLGFHRKAFCEVQFLATGSGTMTLTVYPNYIYTPSTLVFNANKYALPGIVLQEQPIDDLVRPLATSGNRVYVGFSTNAVGAAMSISKLIMVGSIDQYATTNPNSG